jgi:hypothetical protein
VAGHACRVCLWRRVHHLSQGNGSFEKHIIILTILLIFLFLALSLCLPHGDVCVCIHVCVCEYSCVCVYSCVCGACCPRRKGEQNKKEFIQNLLCVHAARGDHVIGVG